MERRGRGDVADPSTDRKKERVKEGDGKRELFRGLAAPQLLNYSTTL